MQLTIAQVGRRIGLRPSAIRYYEQIGIVPAADRVRGQRRYDETGLYRLTVVKRARELGFTLQQQAALLEKQGACSCASLEECGRCLAEVGCLS